MIKLEGITKEYGGVRSRGFVRALQGIDLEIREGKLLALLGPNGAGKTTLIKIIAGLVAPTSGNVFVEGFDLIRQRRQALASIGGVFEGNRNIYWYMSPKENLNYFANIRGKPSKPLKARIKELIAFFNLQEKADVPVKKLSRGMQQKVALAVALVTDPKILLLDEPTLGLDLESYFALKDCILELAKEEKKIILLATHQINLIDNVADEVAVIREGKILLMDSTRNLKRSFGVERYIIQAKGTLGERHISALREFGSVALRNNQRVTTLDLTLTHSTNLFDTLAALKEMNVGILSINKEEPKLDDIFLHIIKAPNRSNRAADNGGIAR